MFTGAVVRSPARFFARRMGGYESHLLGNRRYGHSDVLDDPFSLEDQMTREKLIKDLARFAVSFKAFFRDGLGYSGLLPPHDELMDILTSDSSLKKLILMPRYSFKSTITTVGFILWRLVRNPDLRILIYSDAAGKAQGFWQDIKNHIEGRGEGSLFRQYYGAWETDPHKGKWNESQGVIRVREKAWKEPTIDTGGIETSKVGMHYDIIVFDDIVSDLNTTTKAQMDKVYDCYKKSLALLKPGGEVLVVGTRWHFGDAYGRMIKDGGFKVYRVDANRDEKFGDHPFSRIGLTKEFLAEQKRTQGSYLYSCLYNNSPVDDETAIFKHDDFRFYEPKSDTKELYKTCTVDPAGEGEDSTGITTVGTDKDLRMHILDVVNRHLQLNGIVDEIFRQSYKWQFTKLGVEGNFFKGALEKEIKLRMEKEMSNPNFKPFSIDVFTATAKRGEGKHNRIQSLQPFHERGHLLFPGKDVADLGGGFGELAFQMIQYPKAPHDDLVDSLAYHIDIIRKGTGIAQVQEVPKYSAAWYEKQVMDETVRMNRRLPRRLKQKFQPAFN